MQNFDDYQQAAAQTAIYPHHGEQNLGALLYVTLGLAGEAGELANKVKKILRDEGGVITPPIRQALIEEIGDCLWYVAMIAHELDYNLAEVARRNVVKLTARKERGTLQGEGDQR